MFAHGEGELSRDTMTSFLGNEGHVMTPSNSQDEPDVNEVKGIQESSCNNNFAVEEHAVKENMDDDDDDDDDDGCDGIASGKERKIDDENENENGDDVNGHLNNEDTPPEERPLLSPEAPSTMTDNANNTKLNSSARNSSSSPPPSTLPVKPTFIDVPVCNTQPAESKTKVFKKHTAGKHLQIDAQTNSIKRKRPSTVRDRNLIANIKTAFMLFIVTLVFIIAFLPALLMANSLIPFNMVVFYGYFVYNVANPFIYAFMNQTFREDVKRIIKLCSR
ncbi:muscarinic acetylcholine receptor M3-like [Aplysia californica]|uniref:Muscarinic acetylcholine receptor M3-like n=1 Tax=Aplysia californica TaxID=6500 RepID=A0ABM1W0N5_APLCA|nr:muscarinic acetylcholine receptor M3-like [Aplysia californica]